MRALQVLEPGPLTTVQDLGRPGLASWGVPSSGALDRGALRLANRLVGNPEAAAGLEVTLGELALQALGPVLLAVTGAPCPLSVDGRPVGGNALLRLAAGQVLRLGVPRTGVRSYVGVRGGLDVPPVLGSRSTDLLSGLGPPVVSAGDVLPVGPPLMDLPSVEQAPVPEPPGDVVPLRVRLGPRDDWFTPAALHLLLSATWTATAESNRVGVRLAGPVLQRTVAEELASEGVIPGALQVPPSGLPTLLLADAPVTGGYPVIAVVLDADLDAAGQLRPSQQLRFRH